MENRSFTGDSMQDNLLSQYSLRVYPRPGVEPLLLALQDNFGADINIVLCCCWLGQQGLQISETQLLQLQTVSADFQALCIQPLRAVRRNLKGRSMMEEFRSSVQALELQAEMHQQQLLFKEIELLDDLTSVTDDPSAVMLRNIQSYLMNIPSLEWQATADNVIELINILTTEKDC
jgi:uncharacterized protein (TIGR02444 family)